MSRENIFLSFNGFNDLRLRSINQSDIEILRLMKNKNKLSFFNQKEISKDEQKQWFEKLKTKNQDHMFVVQQLHNDEWVTIGCMGYRVLDNSVDIYNIIRGLRLGNPSFKFQNALEIMINYILKKEQLDITCLVLINNPAINWYKKNKFEIIEKRNDHYYMKLNR